MIQTSYCLDCVGNLIRLEASAPTGQLIPYAAAIVSTAGELASPYPWTLTIQRAIKEVRFAPARLVAGTIAEQVHRSGQVPRSALLYVEPTEDHAEDEAIMELIELHDELPPGADGRRDIEVALASVGVVQIPMLPDFSPELHDGTVIPGASKYRVPGWISNSRVYRKARS